MESERMRERQRDSERERERESDRERESKTKIGNDANAMSSVVYPNDDGDAQTQERSLSLVARKPNP
jgi:hypothetical protein